MTATAPSRPASGGTALMVQARGLGKAFEGRRALVGVDLEIHAAEAVAVLGPNGAGKTTLLRLVAQLSRPTTGSLRVGGLDATTHGPAIRQTVGFLSHHPLLYDDLTARQNLHFYARLYGVSGARRRVDELLARVGLQIRRDDLVRTYSQGMRQRLAIARALLHEPAILLLDEPFSGLDLDAAQLLEELICEVTGRGCTLLLSTHDLPRALDLCRRAVILRRGRVRADLCIEGLTPAELAAVYEELAGSGPRPAPAPVPQAVEPEELP